MTDDVDRLPTPAVAAMLLDGCTDVAAITAAAVAAADDAGLVDLDA